MVGVDRERQNLSLRSGQAGDREAHRRCVMRGGVAAGRDNRHRAGPRQGRRESRRRPRRGESAAMQGGEHWRHQRPRRDHADVDHRGFAAVLAAGALTSGGRM